MRDHSQKGDAGKRKNQMAGPACMKIGVLVQKQKGSITALM